MDWGDSEIDEKPACSVRSTEARSNRTEERKDENAGNSLPPFPSLPFLRLTTMEGLPSGMEPGILRLSRPTAYAGRLLSCRVPQSTRMGPGFTPSRQFLFCI